MTGPEGELPGAFINEVEAQAGQKIPQEDANRLITIAQQIINLLNAG